MSDAHGQHQEQPKTPRPPLLRTSGGCVAAETMESLQVEGPDKAAVAAETLAVSNGPQPGGRHGDGGTHGDGGRHEDEGRHRDAEHLEGEEHPNGSARVELPPDRSVDDVESLPLSVEHSQRDAPHTHPEQRSPPAAPPPPAAAAPAAAAPTAAPATTATPAAVAAAPTAVAPPAPPPAAAPAATAAPPSASAVAAPPPAAAPAPPPAVAAPPPAAAPAAAPLAPAAAAPPPAAPPPAAAPAAPPAAEAAPSVSAEACAGAQAGDPERIPSLPGCDDAAMAPASAMSTSSRDGAVLLRVEPSGPGSEPPLTVHALLERAARRHGERVALAANATDGGDGAARWYTLSWERYYRECRHAAKAFLQVGLQRFHGVGILGFNSIEWFVANIGAILAGGLAVGIYTTNSAEACQYVASDCQANVIVVDNGKQLQKILQIRAQLPHLKAIVVYRDAVPEGSDGVYSWLDFMKLGDEVSDERLDAAIAEQRANQCCSLIYTSGTTGPPKGVMLSHDNLTWTSRVASEMTGFTPEDVTVSYLPLSHVAAQMLDLWVPMQQCGAVYFAQPDALKGSLVGTLKEVQPTVFLGVPRVWEKMMEAMRATGAQAGAVRRAISAWARGIGLEANRNAMKGEGSSPWGYGLASALVFRRVRAALGLGRCGRLYVGAAPASRETLEFFLSLDMAVLELYGMSESSGPHTLSTATACRLTSCGKSMFGCRTRLALPDAEGCGELCFWGRNVFMGYLGQEAMTHDALDPEGWLHSGDLGRIDEEGFVFITGRLKELIITAGGENVAPVPIEDAVKEALPIVSFAMVIGDKRKFLSMLLTLKCSADPDTGEPGDQLSPEAVQFCRSAGSSATLASQVAPALGGRGSGGDAAVLAAIQQGIERVNRAAISNAQRVQKWALIPHDFTVSGGELGPTMKLRRPVVLRLYQEVVDAFYAEAM
ncbi:long-chain-fatty-acid--CoA ligase ACSBG2-like isoform X2 [Lampetra fluviatilis]